MLDWLRNTSVTEADKMYSLLIDFPLDKVDCTFFEQLGPDRNTKIMVLEYK